MARIVLGIGCSHTAQLNTSAGTGSSAAFAAWTCRELLARDALDWMRAYT